MTSDHEREILLAETLAFLRAQEAAGRSLEGIVDVLFSYATSLSKDVHGHEVTAAVLWKLGATSEREAMEAKGNLGTAVEQMHAKIINTFGALAGSGVTDDEIMDGFLALTVSWGRKRYGSAFMADHLKLLTDRMAREAATPNGLN
ncbi:hypothetical protein [Terrihabitans sp. B22-R8]|uniref:hypothetical protein n=1 Tax=Terrihabitans sp. B22-R8 TaxID=3425128 RepID=UPI00403D249B